jgi:hypothetical protein
MADKKISQLSSASTPLAGTEVLPIVQSSTTVKVSVADLTAGRAISATQVTASTGNFIVGTAGKGIDFSANTSAAGMTSELLTWYEEGTWTPTVTATTAGDLNVSYSAQTGVYTRIGRLITVNYFITTSAFTYTTASGEIRIAGLPFTVSSTAGADSYAVGTLTGQGWTKANYGTFNVASVQNATQLRLVAAGSAQNATNLNITDFASGNFLILRGSASYIA